MLSLFREVYSNYPTVLDIILYGNYNLEKEKLRKAANYEKSYSYRISDNSFDFDNLLFLLVSI